MFALKHEVDPPARWALPPIPAGAARASDGADAIGAQQDDFGAPVGDQTAKR
jgi:hypothetical protein